MDGQVTRKDKMDAESYHFRLTGPLFSVLGAGQRCSGAKRKDLRCQRDDHTNGRLNSDFGGVFLVFGQHQCPAVREEEEKEELCQVVAGR